MTLIEFCLPLAGLLAVRYGLGQSSGLSLAVFLAGTGLEALLCFALLGLRRGEFLEPARFELYDFLVRLLVGLPFTAYLLVAAPYSIVALLRFFPVFLFLLGGRRFRFALRYFLFFLLGGLLFALFKDFPFPAHVQSVTLGVTALLGALLYIRELELRGREVVALKQKRDRSRLARRLHRIEERERRVLEASMPVTQARLFRENRTLRPRSEDGLLVAYHFPGIHESLLDFAGAVDLPTREKGLDGFAGEWDRFITFLMQTTSELQLQLARKGETLYAVRRLPDEDALEADLFRVLFRALECVRYAERTRRSLEHRGRVGWRVHCAITRGEIVGLPQAGGSPGWMFLGEPVRSVERFFADPPASQEGEDACWVAPTLNETIYPFFEEESGRFYHGWYQPGYLKPEFARDEHRLEPADDFFERLRFS